MLPVTFKHSATAGNTYASAPSAFIYKWVLRNWGEDSARMVMGTAIDHGVGTALMNDLSDEEAVKIAVAKFDELRQGEVTEERGHVSKIALRFLSQLRPLGKPVAF